MRSNLQAIILAAGKSSRFNSDKSKLLEKICGKEMILYPKKLLDEMDIPTTFVIGYQKDEVQGVITAHSTKPATFVTQEEQHGTGHALLCSKDTWEKEDILIMNGDVPLVSREIIETLHEQHMASGATLSFVMAHNSDPSSKSYGRVIINDHNTKIVEAKEFDGDLHEHCCINAGIYIVKRSFLQDAITEIKESKVTKEFYITDLVHIASVKQCKITTITAPFDHIRGINTYQELWAAEQVKKAELIRKWMKNGVRFEAAQSVHLDVDVTIGSGTFIGCSVHLLNGTRIGKNSRVNAFSIVENSALGDNTVVHSHTIVKDSVIGSQTHVGPFAHIRNNTILADNTTIGNFVEVKNSTVGHSTKAKHLTYLGDAIIGKEVNIGAGTITCNHTGVSKEKTHIKDNAYIGSNNSLVAPVTIGTAAYTGAGSVITKNVPADALGLGRARQINKEGYAKKIRERTSDRTMCNENKGMSFIAAHKTNNDTTILK